ncbi:MAG: CopG family transcriptional regulator [Sterolibacterium sp.]
MENRTSRLTLLIDPDKKRIFEDICAAQDLTPSQVVRKLIRQYIIDHAGNRELPAWLVANTAQRASSLPAGNDLSQGEKPEQIAAEATDETGENR